MSKKKKNGHKNRPIEKIVLVTAIIQLISALISLINNLIE